MKTKRDGSSVAGKKLSRKIEKFLDENPEILEEYNSLGIDSYSLDYDLMEEHMRKIMGIRSDLSPESILCDAFQLSIQDASALCDTLQDMYENYVKASDSMNGTASHLSGVNITQIYFNEVGKLYKKYKSSKNTTSINDTSKEREKAILLNTKQVISIAKRYRGLGLSLDDLISAGNLGLCVAWDKYDPSRNKLHDELIDVTARLPNIMKGSDIKKSPIRAMVNEYGELGLNFDRYFTPDEKEFTKSQIRHWINSNVRPAKFSSIAAMWIRAYILIELDNFSRTVKKPRSEIQKDRLNDGCKGGSIISLDSPISSDSNITLSDTDIASSPPEYTDSELIGFCQEYKDALALMLDGVPARSRSVVLKKFGVGIPRPLLPREIAHQEGISISRVAQLQQQTIEKMKENCAKYQIDPGPIFEAVSKFR